jgi:hypothetical protein
MLEKGAVAHDSSVHEAPPTACGPPLNQCGESGFETCGKNGVFPMEGHTQLSRHGTAVSGLAVPQREPCKHGVRMCTYTSECGAATLPPAINERHHRAIHALNHERRVRGRNGVIHPIRYQHRIVTRRHINCILNHRCRGGPIGIRRNGYGIADVDVVGVREGDGSETEREQGEKCRQARFEMTERPRHVAPVYSRPHLSGPSFPAEIIHPGNEKEAALRSSEPSHLIQHADPLPLTISAKSTCMQPDDLSPRSPQGSDHGNAFPSHLQGSHILPEPSRLYRYVPTSAVT